MKEGFTKEEIDHLFRCVNYYLNYATHNGEYAGLSEQDDEYIMTKQLYDKLK